MDKREQAVLEFNKWYSSLRQHSPSGGVAKGTTAAALVVIDRLMEDFNLELEAHRAPGGAQIKGASGAAVAKILARFGETRPFAKEGGRTNRGAPGDIKLMLQALSRAKLDKLNQNQRNEILTELQRILVNKVVEFHNRERLKIVYDPSKTTWQLIHELLLISRDTGKEGPVAQHLVGAKLQLRFPEVELSNESYSTADDQLGRPGDFYLGDTAFHVTVAPMQPVFEKCKSNLENGLRVYLLVPDRCLSGARQSADLMISGRIAVESIESFVSQNIEELSFFKRERLTDDFYELIETYNDRVVEAEIDKSMMIEIPQNLLKRP